MNTQRSMFGFAIDGLATNADVISNARPRGASAVRRAVSLAKWGPILGVFAMAAGCASYPAPVQRMASSEAAIRGAQEVGSSSDPQAQLHLKLAQEQLVQAKQLMNDGDNKRADYVLLRADADAELAIALAREVSTKAAAEQASQQVQTMRQRPQ